MPETLQRNNNSNTNLRLRNKDKRRPSIYGTIPEPELNILSQGIDFKCANCKERNYFIELPNDNKHAFCKNCGHLTPLRTLRHLRGIAIPNIQQDSIAVLQASDRDKKRGANRKPSSMRDNIIIDPAIEMIATKSGIQIIDSQTNSSSGG